MSNPKFTREEALAFHLEPTPGKWEVSPTVPMNTQRDLSLAYSPGVAVPCEDIAKDPGLAYDYTNKGNLVAVISNGTAVLGLGNLGALGSKPVMEGKAVLFKRFADVNSIDIELDSDPQSCHGCSWSPFPRPNRHWVQSHPYGQRSVCSWNGRRFF